MALAAPLPNLAERRGLRLGDLPVYWHLLSLDAPTLTVLWAWSLVRAEGLPASAPALAVLGLGTWLLYVGDRLLDSGFPAHRHLHERHFFHAHHRLPLLVACAAASPLLLSLIVIMPAAARRDDAIVFAVALLYFASVHLPAIRVRSWFPRECVVGMVFACATAVPAWSAPASSHPRLAGPVLLFMGLCCLNCIGIEFWERSRPQTRVISAFALVLAAMSVALLLANRTGVSGARELCASAFASAILLLLLDRLHGRFLRRNPAPASLARFLLAVRIAADAALLTPILFVIPWRR